MHTVAATWKKYYEMVLKPAAAGRVQVQETRRAYYAGAYSMLGLLVERGDLEEDEAVRAIERLRDECTTFFEAVGTPIEGMTAPNPPPWLKC